MKYKIVVYDFIVRDRGRGFIIKWNDPSLFYKTLLKWILIQDDTTLYEGNNYWVQIDGLRGDSKAKLIVIGRKGKDFQLDGKFLKVVKTGFWKRGVDYEINKVDEKWVEAVSKDDIANNNIRIDTTGEWILSLTRIGMILAGGVLLWRKLKK